MKPNTKKTIYSQSNEATLPTLDPTKQDVAKPYEPTNKSGNEAAEYLVPDTGAAPPMSADDMRSSAATNDTETGAVVVGSDPTAEAAIKAAEKEAAANNEPSAFDKAVGHVQQTGAELKKDFAGASPSSIYTSIDDVVSYDEGKVDVEYAKIADRVDAAFGTPGASRSLTSDSKSSILDAVDIYGSKSIGVDLGDVTALLDPDQYTDAVAITDMISRVTSSGGALDLLDFGAQASLIHGLADKLMDWNVPSLIDKLIEMIDDQEEKEEMYEEMCVRAANRGDMDLVRHYGDLIEGKRRSAIWKDVVSALMSRFYIRTGDDRALTSLGSTLLSTFAMFNGSWDKDPDDGSYVNLYYYSIASRDAESVLRHTDRRVHAAAGHAINIERPWTTITRNFKDLN